tara:strand:+ start:3118 stop:3360 length:243 start_codon:yes stop_codon:yes gene_type:complete
MDHNGFKQMKMIQMYEMFIISFIKKSKQGMLKGVVKTDYKACGKDIIGTGIKFGNKGGLHMHFKLNDKHFNFIACHLQHG